MIVTTLASIAAVALGAGPTTLAAIYLVVSGAGSLLYFRWDIARRFPQWVSGPAMPTLREFGAAVVHLKWFSLQIIGPTVWLQAPVLVFDAFNVSGRDIASFLLIRTMVNQIRQAFQFATIGAGIEIAPLAHRGDFAGAWRLSARIGLMTTVLCGVMVAAVLVFGENVTRYWVGDATLFSPAIAIGLLAPLLAIVFLQQPVALLQYANMSLAPGLQRLLQIVLGPLMCIAGQKFYGVTGLVAGLAISEVLANWALAPLLANMKIFSEFWRYCLSSAAAGLAALAASLALGVGLMQLFPSPSLGVLAMNMAIWSALDVCAHDVDHAPRARSPVAAAAPASGPSESRGILRQRCSSGCQRRFGPSPIPPIFSCCWRSLGLGLLWTGAARTGRALLSLVVAVLVLISVAPVGGYMLAVLEVPFPRHPESDKHRRHHRARRRLGCGKLL